MAERQLPKYFWGLEGRDDEIVRCYYEECKVTLPRKQMKEHCKSCDYVPYCCNICFKKMAQKNKEHQCNPEASMFTVLLLNLFC